MNNASNKEIAANLRISEKPVKNHIRNIFQKLNVSDRTEAAILAMREGLINVHPKISIAHPPLTTRGGFLVIISPPLFKEGLRGLIQERKKCLTGISKNNIILTPFTKNLSQLTELRWVTTGERKNNLDFSRPSGQ